MKLWQPEVDGVRLNSFFLFFCGAESLSPDGEARRRWSAMHRVRAGSQKGGNRPQEQLLRLTLPRSPISLISGVLREPVGETWDEKHLDGP